VFSPLAPFDVFWAGISPVLAFLIRDGAIYRVDSVAIYCAVALFASLAAFQWFRISSPILEFFSFHDAYTVAKACLTTAALTAVTLFLLNRLEDAPRAVPVIHFLILGCGLIAVRALQRFRRAHYDAQVNQRTFDEIENILIVGATRPARFFMALLEEFSFYDRRIIAIVDERPSLRHRTLNGYPIVGASENLAEIVDEYTTHGIEIGTVVIAIHPKELPEKISAVIRNVCNTKGISIEWLHEKFSFEHLAAPEGRVSGADSHVERVRVTRGPYWKLKRLLDFSVSIALMITLAPLTVLVAVLVWLDVGLPLVFWQQRLGQFGHPLRIYKFRTMRNSLKNGHALPESARISLLGRLLRRSRLDEIPQLFNILNGTMSLVGPRPLLPIDQPKQFRNRLQVPPGLTGLAQINGGTLLSPEEKDALDEWYVQHMSPTLDVKILFRTLLVILRGERRDESIISMAVADKDQIQQSMH